MPLSPCPVPDTLVGGLGKVSVEVFTGKDYIAVFEKDDDILALNPDESVLRSLDLRGVAVTAPGRFSEKGFDFVLRCRNGSGAFSAMSGGTGPTFG